MTSKEKQTFNLSRRQFAKSFAAGTAGLMASSLGPLDAFAEQEGSIQDARKKYTNTLSGSPHVIDQKRYKRFSQKNMAFNVVSRELGKPWMEALFHNAVGNVIQGKSGKDIDAGSFDNARAELAMLFSTLQSDQFLGTHGEGDENRGTLNWQDLTHLVPDIPPVFPPNPGPTCKDAEDLTKKVKFMARLSGADIVGICRLDPRWIYSEGQRNSHTPQKPELKPFMFESASKPFENKDKFVIPNDTNYAIVMGYSMNRRLLQTSPSLMSFAGAELAYTRMGLSSMQMATFIRTLGYNAIPCKNGTGLSVPMAVDAGLGECGRNSVLITPEYGPAIRLDKVLTNMPLVPDKPIEFGVQDFCQSCKKCARECPSKSISQGDKEWEGPGTCNNPGAYKWHNDLEKCLMYWVENGSACGNCLAVCPFTKGAMWTHDATRWAIDKAKFLDPVWLNLDDAFGFGETRNSAAMWDSDMSTYGIDPDQLKKWQKKS